MRSRQSHPHYGPTGLGALMMDPEFLRHAWHDGDIGRAAGALQAEQSHRDARARAALLLRRALGWRATFRWLVAVQATPTAHVISAGEKTRSDR
jgi:hypothetical protein